ncbi:MAG: hypothetical protein ACKOE8_07890 [Opitutaceae bacterium]
MKSAFESLPGFPLAADFRPATGTMDEWNAAYVRVEDYLRAHRIHNRLHQSRLIQRILGLAAARHAADPAKSPTVLAAEESARLMEAWFGAMLERSGPAADRLATDGRVALLLCDGPARWPYAFLDEREIPPEFRDAMREGVIRAGPDLTVSSMVPRPIDLGPIPDAAGDTIERMERWPVLRTLTLWLALAAMLGALFRLTR